MLRITKRTRRLGLELVLLVFGLVAVIGPISSLVIWSVAETWFWPHALPQQVGLAYWRQALGLETSLAIGALSIVPALVLSVFVAVVTVVLAMAISIPAGYALAKYRIPFGGVLLLLFLMPNAFPQMPVFVNLLRIFTRSGLAGTVPAVIIVHMLVGIVFAVWITTATFKSIPAHLEEAARSVGATKFTAFMRITLPLAAPGLLASAVFVFLKSLEEFTGTFLVGLPFVRTLPMMLYSASGYNMQYASVTALVLLVPSILFMVVVQKLLRAEYVGGMGAR